MDQETQLSINPVAIESALQLILSATKNATIGQLGQLALAGHIPVSIYTYVALQRIGVDLEQIAR